MSKRGLWIGASIVLFAMLVGLLLWGLEPGAGRIPGPSQLEATADQSSDTEFAVAPWPDATDRQVAGRQSLRLRFESALPGIPCPPDPIQVSVTGQGPDGSSQDLRFDQNLPGMLTLDATSLRGPVTIAAWSRFFVLDTPKTLVPPYPEEVLLALEPKAVLTVDLTEMPDGAVPAELLVLCRESEDLTDAKADGRWRVLEEPGTWTFEHLESGTYSVEVRPIRLEPGMYPVDQPALRYSAEVDVTLGKETVLVLPDYDRDSVLLSGDLLGEHRPIPNARLRLHVLRGGFQSSVRTGEGGRFSTEILGSGPVRCELLSVDGTTSHFRNVWMLDVPSVASHHVELRLPRATVAGRVVDSAGEPCQGVRVRIYRLPLEDLSPSLEGFASATTDEEGHYIFKALPPGQYLVNLQPRSPVGPEPGHGFGYASLTVEVDAGPVTAPDLVLGDAIHVQGGLTLDGNPPPEASLSRVMIFLRPVGSEDGYWIWLAWTDREGRFEGQSVGPGSYDLFATGHRVASPGGLRVQLPADAEWIDVPLVPAGRFHVHWIDSTGKSRRFKLGILDESGRALPADGANDEQRSEQISRWLAPGRYTLRVQGWNGPPREKEVELGAGDLEVRILGG